MTSTLVVCALVTTGLVVRRELFEHSRAFAQSTAPKPVFIKNWKSQLEHGVQLGLTSAPVQLVEFADFECPFCGNFHRTLKSVRDRYPDQIALTYVHFPLPMHRFAIPAARVSECAGKQGRFEAMYDELFEQQDQFGLKPWSEFASESGVPDGAEFMSCIQSKNPVPRIVEGQKLGQQLDIKGTPTLIINGWMLAGPPSTEDLDHMVKAILAGKSPVAIDGKGS